MKWISIEEKHPNYWEDREVIVFMPNAYTKIDVQTVYNNSGNGSRFSRGWNKGEGEYEVTHWQPLPQTPKQTTDQSEP